MKSQSVEISKRLEKLRAFGANQVIWQRLKYPDSSKSTAQFHEQSL